MFNLHQGVEDYGPSDTNVRTLEAWWQLGKDLSAPVRDSSNNQRDLAVFIVQETTPAGMLVAFGGITAPVGWFMCDGSAVSRTTYADLFAAIGVDYGIGDGATTFNIPDMRGRFPQGKDSGEPTFDALGGIGGEKAVQMTVDQVPVHMHGLRGAGHGDGDRPIGVQGPDSSGFGTNTITPGQTARGVGSNVGINEDIASPNNSHNNMSPFQVVNFIIQF